MLKKTLCSRYSIAAVSLLAVSAGASANVEISRAVYVPQGPGLSLSGSIPTEFDDSNVSGSVTLSAADPGLSALLASLQLPASHSDFTNSSVSNLCMERTTVRQVTGRLVMDDSAWLKSRSLFCRLERKLFGACKPKGAADLFEHGRFELAGPVTETSGPESVAANDGSGCSSSAQGTSISQLQACAASGGDARPCLDAMSTGQVKREGDRWVVLHPISETSVERRVQSTVTQIPGTMDVSSLSLGALQVVPARPMSVVEALGAFGSNPAQVSVAVEYSVRGGGAPDSTDRRGGQWNASYQPSTVLNFPSTVTLQASDILSYDELTDTQTARPDAERLLDWCRTSVPSDDFAKFICLSSGPGLVDLLAKRVQIRVHFLDGQGVERLLTFERLPPVQFCSLVQGGDGQNGIRCQIPDAEYHRWVADPSDLFRRLKSDPSMRGARIRFDSIERFLPRARDASPLTSFTAPQAHTLSVVQ